MENSNNKDLTIYEFIDYVIGDLLLRETKRDTKKIEVRKVIEIILKIESLIPEIPMDGDDFVKHFKKKP